MDNLFSLFYQNITVVELFACCITDFFEMSFVARRRTVPAGPVVSDNSIGSAAGHSAEQTGAYPPVSRTVTTPEESVPVTTPEESIPVIAEEVKEDEEHNQFYFEWLLIWMHCMFPVFFESLHRTELIPGIGTSERLNDYLNFIYPFKMNHPPYYFLGIHLVVEKIEVMFRDWMLTLLDEKLVSDEDFKEIHSNFKKYDIQWIHSQLNRKIWNGFDFDIVENLQFEVIVSVLEQFGISEEDFGDYCKFASSFEENAFDIEIQDFLYNTGLVYYYDPCFEYPSVPTPAKTPLEEKIDHLRWSFDEESRILTMFNEDGTTFTYYINFFRGIPIPPVFCTRFVSDAFLSFVISYFFKHHSMMGHRLSHVSLENFIQLLLGNKFKGIVNAGRVHINGVETRSLPVSWQIGQLLELKYNFLPDEKVFNAIEVREDGTATIRFVGNDGTEAFYCIENLPYRVES
jgi:hypothetical protein